VKLFKRMRDGGPDSPVIGYFLVEIKSLFSIVLLHFTDTREAYHSHAFNALTFWLKGKVVEYVHNGGWKIWYAGDWKYTPRNLMHKVRPLRDAWALSIRGPWSDTWQEYKEGQYTTLAHGRKVVEN
jgi:hypothetical protein